MPTLIQGLQVLSGLAWLLPAVLLTPAVARTLRGGASRTAMLSTPICFTAWVQAGFTLRWLIWDQAVPGMERDELLFWAGLYALSSLCAIGMTVGAWLTRGER